MNKNLIYGLKCPFTKEIHYIGKTTQGMLRPLQHLSKSQNEKVREWVNSLKELGHAPGIEIIEDNINIEELDDKEKFWINHFLEKGNLLLNIQFVDSRFVIGRLEALLDSHDENDISHIGTFIKNCRKIANLTQPEFASKTGVALKVLRKIEQNKTNVELSGVLKILNMFGCTLDVKKIE